MCERHPSRSVVRWLRIAMVSAPLAGCALQMPGRTIADTPLQVDTLRAVMLMDLADSRQEGDEGCQSRKVVNTQIVEPLVTGWPGIRGKWVERWTLDRCGKLVHYAIKFFAGHTGTLYRVSRESTTVKAEEDLAAAVTQFPVPAPATIADQQLPSSNLARQFITSYYNVLDGEHAYQDMKRLAEERGKSTSSDEALPYAVKWAVSKVDGTLIQLQPKTFGQLERFVEVSRKASKEEGGLIKQRGFQRLAARYLATTSPRCSIWHIPFRTSVLITLEEVVVEQAEFTLQLSQGNTVFRGVVVESSVALVLESLPRWRYFPREGRVYRFQISLIGEIKEGNIALRGPECTMTLRPK